VDYTTCPICGSTIPTSTVICPNCGEPIGYVQLPNGTKVVPNGENGYIAYDSDWNEVERGTLPTGYTIEG
jgi:hypothetical protein